MTDQQTRDPKRKLSRRAVAAALAGTAIGATAAWPALAQFSFGFGGGNNNSGFGGMVLDLGRVFETLRNAFDDMGEKDEMRMASSLYPGMLERAGGPYPNSRVQDAIKKFAEPVFATSTRPAFNWDINITNDNSLNAWAIPGGKLAINKGLLRYIAEPSELAAVIAHEMAHAEFSHGLKMMRQKSFSDGLSDIAREAIVQELGGGMAAGMVSEKAMEKLEEPIYKLVTSGYSQEMEREADAHIMTVFRRTGHDPSEAANPFKVLLDVTPTDEYLVTSLFSSHPDTRDRIAAIEQAAASMAAPVAPVPKEGFVEIKQSFPTRKRVRG